MNTQELHSEFQAQLVRRGLPADYAQRAAEELADHHRDVVEELCAAGSDAGDAEYEAMQRVGDTQQLVKKAVREYQRRHWCGRWPLLTFLFGPIVLLLAAWVATLLFFYGLSEVLDALAFEDRNFDHSETAEYAVKLALIGWLAFATPVAVMWFMWHKVKKAGMGKGWLALAAVMLALNVGTMKIGLVASPPVKNTPSLEPDMLVISTPMWVFFGTSMNGFHMFAGGFQQLCQLLVPLLTALLLVVLHQRFSRGALQTSTGFS